MAVERRAPEPLIELSLFRKVKFDVITLAGSLSNVVYCLIAVLSALYLQQARGLTPTQAGVIFLALSCGVGAASYRAGHLALRWHAETLMACGMLTSGAGLLALTWVQPLGWYAVVFAICGVGIGLGWALTNVATQAHVPAERTGAASGLVLTSLVLFGAVSVTIAATVLEAVSGSPTTAAADGPAIEAVLRGTSVLAFLGAFGLFAICRPRLRAHAPGSGRVCLTGGQGRAEGRRACQRVRRAPAPKAVRDRVVTVRHTPAAVSRRRPAACGRSRPPRLVSSGCPCPRWGRGASPPSR